MITLQKNLHQFNPEDFGTVSSLRDSLESPDSRLLLVTCCDHSDAPDNLSLIDREQLVIVQNMAASIPSPNEQQDHSSIASIELAMEHHKIEHVVVCGHLECRIIPYWLTHEDRLPSPLCPSDFHQNARSLVESSYSEIEHRREFVSLMIREHLLCQLENLQAYDFIHQRLDTNKLKLHAWLVDDATARVNTYDPSTGRFNRINGVV